MNRLGWVYIDDQSWEAFCKKYPDVSKRLRELIQMDLEGKLPEGEGVLISWKKNHKDAHTASN